MFVDLVICLIILTFTLGKGWLIALSDAEHPTLGDAIQAAKGLPLAIAVCLMILVLML